MKKDPLPPIVKTECCDYAPSPLVPFPVYWNPFNKVVQCHNCGTIWRPIRETKRQRNAKEPGKFAVNHNNQNERTQ